MGILGVYPADGSQINPDDMLIVCAGCGTRKMVTQEFVYRVGQLPVCRCGSKQWTNMSAPPPSPLRPFPTHWVQMPANLIEDAQIGVRAGWSTTVDGQVLVHQGANGEASAWRIRQCFVAERIPLHIEDVQ